MPRSARPAATSRPTPAADRSGSRPAPRSRCRGRSTSWPPSFSTAMRCSFKRKPAWSEPMAIRMGAPAVGDPVSVRKSRRQSGARRGRSGLTVGRAAAARSLAGSVGPRALPKVTPYLLRRADDDVRPAAGPRVRGRRAVPRSGAPVPDARRLPRRGARRPRRAHGARARRLRRSRRRPRARGAPGARRRPARWYVEMFGDRAAAAARPRARRADRLAGPGLRIGGWVDLTVRRPPTAGSSSASSSSGAGGSPVDDPLELEAVRVAVLRLSPWCDGATAAGRRGPTSCTASCASGRSSRRASSTRRATGSTSAPRRGPRTGRPTPRRGAGRRLRRLQLRRRAAPSTRPARTTGAGATTSPGILT